MRPVVPCTCITAHDRMVCVGWCKPYGGITREDRIDEGGDGPWCDKAWHLDKGEKVAATVVLTCAFCGRKFARCAACNQGVTPAATSMRAHVGLCKLRRRGR